MRKTMKKTSSSTDEENLIYSYSQEAALIQDTWNIICSKTIKLASMKIY